MDKVEDQTLRGIATVRVKKDMLATVIRQNRDEHRKIFEEAIEGWKKEAIKRLEQAVEDAKAGRDFLIGVRIDRPEDHTKEYNQVLKMLEMSLDDELELTARDFQQFVMDEWGWQAAFLRMSESYGSETASSKKQLNV